MNKVYVIGRDAVPEHISLGSGESLSMTLVAMPGTSCDLKMDIDIDGEDVLVDLAGLYVCLSDESVRMNVNVRHNSGHSESHQLFKGVVSGTSNAEFDGLIYVREGAMQTKAFQENHALILSRGAVAGSRPQLEIYADDVECSHGATTGFLNEDEQFYMRSRGIPEAEARQMQILSFLSPVLARLDDGLREQVTNVL